LSNILQNIINNDNLKTLYDDVGWTDKDISWEKRIKDAVFPVLDHGPLMPD
jgi:hypothetical protein